MNDDPNLALKNLLAFHLTIQARAIDLLTRMRADYLEGHGEWLFEAEALHIALTATPGDASDPR